VSHPLPGWLRGGLLGGLLTLLACPATARETLFPGTAVEQAALLALAGDKPIRARELATEILRQRPDSYAAHLVLGRYYHEQEANLPRAQFHLRRAVRLFEKQCGLDGSRCGEEAWRWRAQALISLVFLMGDMDQREQELAWLDRYEASYNPPRHGLRAWALMKLNRFAEARRVAQEGIAQGSEEQQESAWTSLCAIESEQQDFEQAYLVCRTAAERLAGDQDDGTVEYRNAGHAAYSLLRLDEAERLFQEATRRPIASYSLPWADLASLYTVEARFPEAVAALGEARAYVRQRPPAYVHNDRARLDGVAAEVLLGLGLAEPALRLLRRAQLAPARLGGTSAKQEQEQAGNGLWLRAAAGAWEQALAEQQAVRPWSDGPGLLRQRLAARFTRWRAGRRAAALFSATDLLVATLRPLHPRGANTASWITGDLVDLLGAGVVLAALDQARHQETRADARPYLDALEAEARLHQGRLDQAVRLADAALAQLPAAEILLRARVNAVAAQAAWRRGDRAAGLTRLEMAMSGDPGLLRRLDLSLPVRFHAEDEVGREVVALLADSPRLRAGHGFEVTASRDQVCLQGPAGGALGCAGLRPRPPDAPPLPRAVLLALAFPEQLFAPPLDLSQLDVRSLEGSSTSGRAADGALKTVLDRITW